MTLTPKRRRVDDDSAGRSDRGEMNLPRSWKDTASFGVAKQIDNQNTPRGTDGNHWRQRSLLVNGVSNDSNEDKSFAAARRALTQQAQSLGRHVVTIPSLRAP